MIHTNLNFVSLEANKCRERLNFTKAVILQKSKFLTNGFGKMKSFALTHYRVFRVQRV